MCFWAPTDTFPELAVSREWNKQLSPLIYDVYYTRWALGETVYNELLQMFNGDYIKLNAEEEIRYHGGDEWDYGSDREYPDYSDEEYGDCFVNEYGERCHSATFDSSGRCIRYYSDYT